MSYQDGKIEPGMLVEIISDGKHPNLTCHVGHCGKVLRACNVHKDHWDIEGAEIGKTGKPCSFYTYHLRPIPPDEEPRVDHQPCEASFAEDLKKWLGSDRKERG